MILTQGFTHRIRSFNQTIKWLSPVLNRCPRYQRQWGLRKAVSSESGTGPAKGTDTFLFVGQSRKALVDGEAGMPTTIEDFDGQGFFGAMNLLAKRLSVHRGSYGVELERNASRTFEAGI